MKLADLFAIFPNVNWGTRPSLPNQEVVNLCFDSRKLSVGCVFVAIKGTKVDGHRFLTDAITSGAAAVVYETGELPASFTGASIKVANSRDALNRLASVFFGEPSKRLFCVGVTGTNGKTTTTHMIETILNADNKPVGVIGTIDHHLTTPIQSRVWKTEMTTPDPMEFQRRLSEFVALGAKSVAIEVSSIGLRQNRVDEVQFDAAIFTNLTRDHLDYHKDMIDYYDAKRRLFIELLPKSSKPKPLAIINMDDEYGKRLLADLRRRGILAWGYGQGPVNDPASELIFRVLEQGFFGSRFTLQSPKGELEFKLQMPGMHNVYNATAAIGAALVAGTSLSVCAKALAGLTGVKGRLEAVPNSRGLYVFVDYAHTDDAIATVLHYLGRIRTEAGLKNKLITVFGCGGDRDKGKRPLMMKAAAAGSDLVILTSDNPRTENPESIMKDALLGVDPTLIGKKIHAIIDRTSGIRRAIELAASGDVVLIAGKGHEDYQIIGTTKYPFSDSAVVAEILSTPKMPGGTGL